MKKTLGDPLLTSAAFYLDINGYRADVYSLFGPKSDHEPIILISQLNSEVKQKPYGKTYAPQQLNHRSRNELTITLENIINSVKSIQSATLPHS